jgi:positive regulator of sigma E activity
MVVVLLAGIVGLVGMMRRSTRVLFGMLVFGMVKVMSRRLRTDKKWLPIM